MSNNIAFIPISNDDISVLGRKVRITADCPPDFRRDFEESGFYANGIYTATGIDKTGKKECFDYETLFDHGQPKIEITDGQHTVWCSLAHFEVEI